MFNSKHKTVCAHDVQHILLFLMYKLVFEVLFKTWSLLLSSYQNTPVGGVAHLRMDLISVTFFGLHTHTHCFSFSLSAYRQHTALLAGLMIGDCLLYSSIPSTASSCSESFVNKSIWTDVREVLKALPGSYIIHSIWLYP